MELQQYVDAFRKQGLGVCAITYDAVETLADFAQRRGITFPLLADPKSEIIRAFGILNTSVPPDHLWYGVPYPGTYIVDQEGVVRSKYFEANYRDRYSAPTILLREFGSAAGTRQTEVKTAHLEMKYYATRDRVRPNLRLTLAADFQLPPKMHVYAPGISNYIPIRFEVEASPYYRSFPVEYPPSEMLYLAPIEETVPVFQGRFRVTQDLVLAGSDVLNPVLAGSRAITLKGRLRYQACDDKICYLPQDVPLEWVLQVEPLDRERPPEPLRHQPSGAADRK